MRAKDRRRPAPCRRQTRPRRRSGRILWALSLALAPLSHSLADPALEEAYASYYEALDGFGPEDLTRELGATIDDVLSQGSHLSRPSTGYKRRQIAEGLLQRARKSLCAGDRSSSSAVRNACITGTRNAAEAAGTRFPPADVGMVAAVCARLMEAEPPGVRCAAH
jgi:hypothetical protein